LEEQKLSSEKESSLVHCHFYSYVAKTISSSASFTPHRSG